MLKFWFVFLKIRIIDVQRVYLCLILTMQWNGSSCKHHKLSLEKRVFEVKLMFTKHEPIHYLKRCTFSSSILFSPLKMMFDHINTTLSKIHNKTFYTIAFQTHPDRQRKYHKQLHECLQERTPKKNISKTAHAWNILQFIKKHVWSWVIGETWVRKHQNIGKYSMQNYV